MIKHYITKYDDLDENENFVCGRIDSWLQINVFGKAICFSKRHITVPHSVINIER